MIGLITSRYIQPKVSVAPPNTTVEQRERKADIRAAVGVVKKGMLTMDMAWSFR